MPDYGMSDPRRIRAVERQAQALEMRKEGRSYHEIAEALGYREHSGAYRAIQTALKRTLQEPSEAVRKMELERLDKMLAGLWPKATTGHCKSVECALGIMERRAKMLGLDAPTKIDITQHIRQVAQEVGIDPDEAVREAERIIAHRR